MLWIKAFHIIAVVLWFSGLFYLPRLFVYHAMSKDLQMNERFKVMERKLYYYLMTPGAGLTLVLGIVLVYFNPHFLQASWLWFKLGLVLLLVSYHAYLGALLQDFSKNCNRHSAVFYRWLNEVPTFFLVTIVLLVVLKS